MSIISLLRRVLIFLTALFAAVLLFALSAVVPIDHTPYTQQDFYSSMDQNLQEFAATKIPAAKNGFEVGIAKENITPSYPTAMAGSGLRRYHFQSVHDSIYVRTMVFSNGSTSVALVSLDMLLVPPELTHLLEDKLTPIGFNLGNTYLSATHTHSSIGNWGKHLAGRLYTGPYDDALIHFIADKVVQSVAEANSSLLRARIRTGTIPISNLLYNRLAGKAGRIDSLLRVIEIYRIDSSRLVLASFTGHPTCDRSNSLELSRDYPGVFVDALEAGDYTFAIFVAGAVGSHGCLGPDRGPQMVNYVGNKLAADFLRSQNLLHGVSDSTLFMARIPLELGKPQFKISEGWCIRPWLYELAFGTYHADLAALRIGSILMIGTPCDFSGELMGPIDSVAMHFGVHAMVTSFNGNYIGYITEDKWYDMDHYETRLMNWYGPGNGAYLTECVIKLVKVLSQ
jgi:Neutral/alkaline non-lysosomal ceramidase, N-terminal